MKRWPLLLAFAFAPFAFPSPAAAESRADRHRPAEVNTNGTAGQVFARIRHAQMKACAATLRREIPGGYEALFRAVEGGDAKTISNAYVRLYTDHTAREKGLGLWQAVQEVGGFYELCPAGDNAAWREMGEEMLRTLPAGAVLFGGTDSGRFLPTTYRDVANAPQVFVLTQNQLADNTYVEWIRWLYGEDLWIPSMADCNQAFQQFVEDAQAGRVDGGGISFSGGRVSITGVAGVMQINGRIARLIFDHNVEQHPFFVEESYVLPWMYPHLEPCGPILRLNQNPIAAIAGSVVAADRAYWDVRTDRILADRSTTEKSDVRKAWSKMRCAIAGVYASRRMWAEAEYAFHQSLRICPDAPESAFRLADLLMQNYRFTEAVAVVEDFVRRVPDNEQMVQWLGTIRATERLNSRRTELEQKMSKGADSSVAVELCGIYQQMKLTNALATLSDTLIAVTNMPSAALRSLSAICREANLTNQAAAAASRAGPPWR